MIKLLAKTWLIVVSIALVYAFISSIITEPRILIIMISLIITILSINVINNESEKNQNEKTQK